MTRNLHALILSMALLFPGSAALSQGFDPSKPYNAQNQDQLVTVIKDPTRTRPLTYRYTAGYKVQKGWEKTLVDGTPNLSHWTWVPVTSYQQKYVRVEPGSMNPRKPGGPTTAQANQAVPYRRSSGGHYVKPVCVRAPQSSYYKNWPKSSNTSVTAKLKAPREVVAQAGTAYSDQSVYSYGDVSGKLTRSHDASMYTQQDVYGKLVSKGHTH